jgi:hypothetical protein
VAGGATRITRIMDRGRTEEGSGGGEGGGHWAREGCPLALTLCSALCEGEIGGGRS